MAPRPRYLYNPAREEYVDLLTGERATPMAVGAAPSGRLFIRMRPAPGKPLQAVYVHREDIDERRASYPLDRSTRAHYKREAAQEAKAQRKVTKRKGFDEEQELLLHRLGIPTTFKTARGAVQEFIDHNDFFEHESMGDPDVKDITVDFMDGIEVARGRRGRSEWEDTKRKHVRLSETARGRDILLGGGPGMEMYGGDRRALAGTGIVREMLVYLFGKAGRKRRYEDVPWDMVDSYLSAVWNVAAQYGGAAQAGQGAPIQWYPLASGHFGESGAEMIHYVSETYGVEVAQKMVDFQTSRELYSMARALEYILRPPKGPNGKEGRKALKCIPADHRKLIRHRAQVLRHWARYPNQVPEWACVPKNYTVDTYTCTFPGLKKDVRMIEDACEAPYDPNWPNELRRKYVNDPDMLEKLHASGVMPLTYDPAAEPTFAVGGEPESLDLPWERVANRRPARRPARRSANVTTLRRRLVRR